MTQLLEHLKRSISVLERLSLKIPFKQNQAFQHARLIGEILTLGASIEVSTNYAISQRAKRLLKSHKSWFSNPAYIEALVEDIKQTTLAHSRELEDINYFFEADAFYELSQLLSGRDGLAFVNEAITHFGNNLQLREAIDSQQINDEILRKYIKDLLRLYADDFTADPPDRWYPSWFWWRHY